MREKAQAVLHALSAQSEGCTSQFKGHTASIAVANLKKTSPLVYMRIVRSSHAHEKTLDWLKCLKDGSDSSHADGNRHPCAFLLCLLGEVGKERKQKLSNGGVEYHDCNAFIGEIKYTPVPVIICSKPTPAGWIMSPSTWWDVIYDTSPLPYGHGNPITHTILRKYDFSQA